MVARPVRYGRRNKVKLICMYLTEGNCSLLEAHTVHSESEPVLGARWGSKRKGWVDRRITAVSRVRRREVKKVGDVS